MIMVRNAMRRKAAPVVCLLVRTRRMRGYSIWSISEIVVRAPTLREKREKAATAEQ